MTFKSRLVNLTLASIAFFTFGSPASVFALDSGAPAPVILTVPGSTQYRFRLDDQEALRRPGTLVLRLWVESDRVIAGSVERVQSYDAQSDQLFLESETLYYLTKEDLQKAESGQFVWGNQSSASRSDPGEIVGAPESSENSRGQGATAGAVSDVVGGLGTSFGMVTQKGLENSALKFQYSLRQFESFRAQQQVGLETVVSGVKPLLVLRTNQKLLSRRWFERKSRASADPAPYRILMERYPHLKGELSRFRSDAFDNFMISGCRVHVSFCEWMVGAQLAFQDFLFAADDVRLFSIIPWAGTMINIYEVATGQDFVEARPLTSAEYSLRVTSLLIGFRTSLGWKALTPEWKEILIDVTWEITAGAIELKLETDEIRQDVLNGEAFQKIPHPTP